jgi:ABC-2 type transport system ATP-binding protein
VVVLGGEAIVAEGLAKLYPGGVWGVRGVSFTSSYGELVTLLGPNGSGKTTTINILATLIKPTSGRALVGGFDVVREAWSVRRIVAVMPQDGRPDLNWTPMEAVKWYLVARGFSVTTADREARVWLERLGLWDVRGRSGWELSGGQRKRVLAAMVLATGAPVLFLDEPTSDVDVEGKYSIWSSIREAVREGRSVLYTTHDMREAERIADRVVMVKEGRVVAVGAPGRLIESLPFNYKMVVSGNASCSSRAALVELGGTRILYFKGRSEALACLAEMEGVTATVEPVSLEDAYIYHTILGGGVG